MNDMITITLSIPEKDASLFYELLANYHRNPKAFVSKWTALLHPTAETPGSPITDGTLYSYVNSNCTCGSCYRRFARSSRERWRGDGQGNFVNCRYRPITITDCPVKDFNGTGYIYDKSADLNTRIKEDALISEQVSRDLDLDLKKEAVAAAKHKTQSLQYANDSKRAEDERVRLASEEAKLCLLERKRSEAWEMHAKKVNANVDQNGGISYKVFLVSNENAEDTFAMRARFYNTPFVWHDQPILDKLRAAKLTRTRMANSNDQWTKVPSKSTKKTKKLNVTRRPNRKAK